MDGRILVIDNSPYERQKITRILEKTGEFEILEAQSVGKFRQHIEENDGYSLIILDIEFPSEDAGFTLLDELRANTSFRETPVIIVTKIDSPDVKSKALKYSVNDYIKKPYQIKRLENSITSLLKSEERFFYDVSGVEEIRMTFEQYVSREIKYSRRMDAPFSLILLTTLGLNSPPAPEQPQSERARAVLAIAAERAGTCLRATDTMAIVKERDVLIVLPNTDNEGAAEVCGKIRLQISEELKRTDAEDIEYMYPVYVTCPIDGEDFQALMKKAFTKISGREILEKTVSIPANTLKYADKSYNRYRRWF